MVYLVFATQYLLCLVSMLLTGLFCVEVANSSSNLLISTVAMVIVGVGFDLGKYVFWHYRFWSKGYLINSLLLVVFSWCASVAFFISHERSNLDVARMESTEYKVYQAEVMGIKKQIHQKTALVQKRLGSNYHAQWDKAEVLVEEIRKLEGALKERVKKMDNVGKISAYENVNTSALFLSLSALLSISVERVTLISYGILALLIECCSLGTISLSKNVNEKNKVKEKMEVVKESIAIEKKMATLRKDIISGKLEPVLRKIRRSGYRLSEKNIRKVLLELKDKGILIDGARCLKLSDT